MNIPTMPVGDLIKEDGTLGEGWQKFFRDLTTELQNNASQEGNVVPQQPTTNITTIAAGTNSQTPRFIYDNTAGALKFTVNGVVKTVTLT